MRNSKFSDPHPSQQHTMFRSKLSMEDMTSLQRSSTTELQRIAFVGNYLPRKCGIATFTHDLRTGFAERFPVLSCHVCAVNDQPEDTYAYPSEVRFEWSEKDPMGYRRLADYVNSNKVDAVCLQHEYGIYGGDCGELILSFLRDVRVPVVTTLHTILQDPNPQQRRVMNAILSLSARVVTMTAKGRSLLQEVYQADLSRVDLIPHGIPEFQFGDPETFKSALQLEGHLVGLTFGLLSPNKGLEYAIRALPAIVANHPTFRYVILGQTHPHLIRDHGEAYRNSLVWLANDLGVGQHVQFVNCFVDMPLLKQYIASADVYITPYLHEAQITSGTLSYAFGMGTAVVSTPYWHAKDLLGEGRGILVPFRDSEQLATSLNDILSNNARRQQLRQAAFELGRSMTWSKVGEMYRDAFERARANPRTQSRVVLSAIDTSNLPKLKWDHVERLTDATGVIQYSSFHVPDVQFGYSTTACALALTLTAKAEGTLHKSDEWLGKMSTKYLAYLLHAMNKETKQFRSELGYDRRWKADIEPSNDNDSAARRSSWEQCHGTVLSALGYCCRFGVHVEVAKRLFLESMHHAAQFDDVVAMGYAADGCSQYLVRYVADAPVVALRAKLLTSLVQRYQTHRRENEWEWFAPSLDRPNAMVSQALITGGVEANEPEWLHVGLKSLGWLCDLQCCAAVVGGTHFTPHAFDRGSDRNGREEKVEEVRAAEVAQQQFPISAQTTVAAAVEAYRRTSDGDWLDVALLAFEWFVGKNSIGSALYEPHTGGTCDGIFGGVLNKNCGAESSLSFLLALFELKTQFHKESPCIA